METVKLLDGDDAENHRTRERVVVVNIGRLVPNDNDAITRIIPNIKYSIFRLSRSIHACLPFLFDCRDKGDKRIPVEQRPSSSSSIIILQIDVVGWPKSKISEKKLKMGKVKRAHDLPPTSNTLHVERLLLLTYVHFVYNPTRYLRRALFFPWSIFSCFTCFVVDDRPLPPPPPHRKSSLCHSLYRILCSKKKKK